MPDVPEWLSDLNVPHLEQYFGTWAIYEPSFKSLVDHVSTLDIAAHVNAQRASGKVPKITDDYIVQDGIAVIPLSGPLMKHPSSLTNGTSTVLARKQVADAAKDDAVSSILLWIDSPGGTAAGTADLADAVARAKKKKPVYAFAEDMMASAAYWIGSQADKLYANRSALVGSIGTFAVIHDYSAQAIKEGVKVYVIRAGEFKGMGVPGTEVTGQHLAESHRVVNQINEEFLKSVESGRSMTPLQVRFVADGRIHVGAEAEKLGLIDGISSLDAVMTELVSKVKKKGPMMSAESSAATETAPKPVMATIANLKASCYGCDAAWREQQIERGATLEQAKEAWMSILAERNEKLQADAKAAADQAAAAAKKPGVDPLTETNGKPKIDNPAVEFKRLVDEKIGAGVPRQRAFSLTVEQNPELHTAYVQSYNQANGRRPQGRFA